jgi:hypothetical protein
LFNKNTIFSNYPSKFTKLTMQFSALKQSLTTLRNSHSKLTKTLHFSAFAKKKKKNP